MKLSQKIQKINQKGIENLNTKGISIPEDSTTDIIMDNILNIVNGGESVVYSNIVYNDDNTITLIDDKGNIHTMSCVYEEDKIVSISYDGENVDLEFNGETLVNVGGTHIDMSNAPATSGGAELNIAYGDTEPTDTSKLWIKANEPSKVVCMSNVEGVGSVKTLETVLPMGMNSMGCTRVGNKIYLLGGYPAGTSYRTNTINVFDIETETITTLSATLPVAIHSMNCATVGTKIYIFGGYTNDPTNTIMVFDTETETVTTLSATVDNHRTNAGCVSAGTKIYLFGGNFYLGGSHYKNTISMFDTETETLTTLSATLPISGGYKSCVRVGTKVYLFGGSKYGGTYVHNSINVFDIETQSVKTLSATLPIECTSMACSLIGNKIYLFGGSSTDENGYTVYLDNIMVFDIETETITTLEATLPKTNGCMGYANIDGCTYFFGGNYDTVINKFILTHKLTQGNMELETDLFDNKFNIVNTDNITLEMGVKNVYIGNENNEAERVEACLYNDNAWVQI